MAVPFPLEPTKLMAKQSNPIAMTLVCCVVDMFDKHTVMASSVEEANVVAL